MTEPLTTNHPAGAAALRATERNAIDALGALLDAHPDLLHYCDPDHHNTLLTFAAVTKRPAAVRLLLARGASVQQRDHVDWTALHAAAYGNPVEQTDADVTAVIELLLDAGADVRAEARGSGGTPLAQALFRGVQPQVDLLAAQEIAPLNLRMAAGLGRLDLLEEFFDERGRLVATAVVGRGYYRPHDSFPEWQPSDHPQEILDEALSYACRNGRVHVLEFLVDRGANIHAVPYHTTALHWAAANNHIEVARWLLDRGAALNGASNFGAERGLSPLHVAAWGGFVPIVQFLVEQGADIAYMDPTHGGTPLGWARFNGRQAVVDYLSTLEGVSHG